MILRRFSKISPYSIAAVLAFAAVMTFILIRSFAAIGTANLYVTPGGTKSVEKGKSFTVDVRVSTAGNVSVTGASMQLSYPSDKLAVQGVSFSGSPYNLEVAQSNSGGILRIERAALPAISGGDKLFAKVTFKALADGSAGINFTNSSFVLSGDNDSNLPLNRSGAAYNIFTSRNPGSPSSPRLGSNSSPVSGGNGSSASGPRSQTSSSTSSVESSSGVSENPSNPDNPSSGAATNSDPSQAGAESFSSLQVLVVDKNNKPVKGAKVTLAGQTLVTDKNGVAGFEGVPLGQHKILVDYSGKKTSYPAEVKGVSDSNPETFTVTLGKRATNPLVWIITSLIGLLIGAGLIILLLRLKQRSNPSYNISTHEQALPLVPATPDNEVSEAIHKIKSPDVPAPGAVVAPVQTDESSRTDKHS